MSVLLKSCSDRTAKITHYLNEYGDFTNSDTCKVDLCEVYGIDFDTILIFNGWDHYISAEPFCANRNDLVVYDPLYGNDNIRIEFIKNGKSIKVLDNINVSANYTTLSQAHTIYAGCFWDGEYYPNGLSAAWLPSKLLAKKSGHLYHMFTPQYGTDILFETDIVEGLNFNDEGIAYKNNIKVRGEVWFDTVSCHNIRSYIKDFNCGRVLRFIYNNKTYYIPVEENLWVETHLVCGKMYNLELSIVFYKMNSLANGNQYCAYIRGLEDLDGTQM